MLDANEIDINNMKCTCPTRNFCVWDPTPPIFHRLASVVGVGVTQILGLASGVTQILALGNAKIYQYVGISYAKFWRRGHCPTPTPDARYFASQWNIVFTILRVIQLGHTAVFDVSQQSNLHFIPFISVSDTQIISIEEYIISILIIIR